MRGSTPDQVQKVDRNFNSKGEAIMTATNTDQKFIAWKESHRVGVASIDGENQRLAKLINRLHNNMLAGHGVEILPQVLYHLEASLNHHFAGEEAMLSAHLY